MLKLTDSGDLDFSTMLSSKTDIVKQRIHTYLRTIQGESIYDAMAGLPFYEEMLVANPNLGKLRSLVIMGLSRVPDVTKINRVDLQFNAKERTLSVSFSVEAGGQTISGEV